MSSTVTVTQWNALLARTADIGRINPVLEREVKSFLTSHDRKDGYTTSQLGEALYPVASPDVDLPARKRFFSCLMWVRKNTTLRTWITVDGQRKAYGRMVPQYVWRSPRSRAVEMEQIQEANRRAAETQPAPAATPRPATPAQSPRPCPQCRGTDTRHIAAPDGRTATQCMNKACAAIYDVKHPATPDNDWNTE